jgi:putative membrane protein insertion efficiency factor
MKRSRLLFGIAALLVLLVALDAMRAPQKQITARLYLGAVRFYQRDLQPLTTSFIRCRYNPTCSRYSIQAVQRFGIAKGLGLTIKRVASCNGSVPMGTNDPIPAR